MARFGHSLPKEKLGGIGLPSWLPDWLTGKDVREIQGPVYIPPRGKAGGYRKELAADIARKVSDDPYTQRNIYSGVQAGADFIPLVGEDVGVRETAEDIEAGNYRAAALGGLGTVLGTVPVVGDMAAIGLKGLAKGLRASTLSAVKPTLEEFMTMAGRGQIRQAKTPQQDLSAILKGKVSATDFDINAAHPFGRKYEEGELTRQLEDAGLVVDDDRMGRVIAGRTQADVDALKNAKTAAEYGRIYGYSDDDIAAFYLKRRGGDPDLAYEEFVREHLPNVEKTASAVVDPVAPKGLGIRAYHGSPHSFEEFDISKIGTGEGAQAYGHGLYFAENRSVAEAYNPSTEQLMAELASGATSPERVKEINRLLDLKADKGFSGPGHMYEVDIAADPEAFLDWDKPLSEQSPTVREQLGGLGSAQKNRPLAATDVGKDVYYKQTQGLTSAGATERLKEAGIPGIRYLDQGSRVAAAQAKLANYEKMVERRPGSSPVMQQEIARLKDEVAKAKANETRNYVVFDPKLIKIVRMYGIGGALGLGLISQEQADQLRAQMPGEER